MDFYQEVIHPIAQAYIGDYFYNYVGELSIDDYFSHT
jgi:hypothetical protein